MTEREIAEKTWELWNNYYKDGDLGSEEILDIIENDIKVLTIPDVSQQREQLFDFYKEMKRCGKLYNDNYTEEKMMQDISDFIKNK